MHSVLFACGFLKDRLGLELPGALCVAGPQQSVAQGIPPLHSAHSAPVYA